MPNKKSPYKLPGLYERYQMIGFALEEGLPIFKEGMVLIDERDGAEYVRTGEECYEDYIKWCNENAGS